MLVQKQKTMVPENENFEESVPSNQAPKSEESILSIICWCMFSFCELLLCFGKLNLTASNLPLFTLEVSDIRSPDNQGLTVISFFQACFEEGLFPFANHDFSVLMFYQVILSLL